MKNILSLILFASLICGSTCSGLLEQTIVYPSVTTGRPYFGYSVAYSSDGTRALVGASSDNTVGTNAGAVYVFDLNPSNQNDWILRTILYPSIGTGGPGFGDSVALSSDGTRALVGAPFDGTVDLNAGAAYVFDVNPSDASDWMEQTILYPSAESRFPNFGYAVALSSDGTRALVSEVGEVFVYDVDPSNARVWTEQIVLTPEHPPDGFGVGFGISVALSSDGTRALVGAYRDDTAYVFDVNPSNKSDWMRRTILYPSIGTGGYGFGSSVALSSDGTRALVGAWLDDTVGTNAGAAYVFDVNPSNASDWMEQTILYPSIGSGDPIFGSSVALSSDGTRALVAAYRDDTVDLNAGAAYLFDVNPSDARDWTEQTILYPSNGTGKSLFARSVALSSDGLRALVGAPRDTTQGPDAGALYAYRRLCFGGNIVNADGTACEPCPSGTVPNKDKTACTVKQAWGDFAMPQRQADAARTGLQAGDFGVFSNDDDEGIVSKSLITLEDLSSVPYNNEEIGPAQTHCPENVSSIKGFQGLGLVQDDELNMYATFFADTRSSTSSGAATYTIKLSRTVSMDGSDDVFAPQWVTCTGNDDTEAGHYRYTPALYKDASGAAYVILRDNGRTQFAIRTSDGGLEHTMVYEHWGFRGDVAVTPDGEVFQPGDNSNVFITSTSDPLSATNFKLTKAEDITTSITASIIQTMGSPTNSFVTYTNDDKVVFFDNVGQSSPSTVLSELLFGNLREISGLKDGRVAVLHQVPGIGPTQATLTIVDSDGSNRRNIDISEEYNHPGYLYSRANVCEGSDGNVYVLDGSCSLLRVDIGNTPSSVENISYTGQGDCDAGEANYLAANEEGVFFATSLNGGDVIEVNGLKYGSSKIEQLGTIAIQDENQFCSGHLVPGAHVSLLKEYDVDATKGESMIAIAAFKVTLPPVEGSSDDDGDDRDAAPALFSNNWMAWSL